jgi:hypothetical protein
MAMESSERDAALETYIELITRDGVVEVGQDEGLPRDALTSLSTPGSRPVHRWPYPRAHPPVHR